MIRFIKISILLAILSIGFHVRAQKLVPSPDSGINQLTQLIDSLAKAGYSENMFPGISISLFQADSIVNFNFGYAKSDKKQGITGKTKFHLGSVGKLFTAIAVLQQVDRGNLDLQADISQYIGGLGVEFKFKDNPVTLHCLLTHSCGFNDVNIGYMAKDAEHIIALEEFVEQFNPGLFQAPGTDIVYSNYSYALAGLIVQIVAKTEFSAYIKENIFMPLGMENSSLNFPYGYQTNDDYANGFRKSKNGFEDAQLYPRHAIPAGSLVSNAEDMGLFIKALFKKSSTILSQPMWELFYTQKFTIHPLLNGYAYGLEKQNINGVESWAKGGMVPGVLSNILIVPNEFAIFTVVNTDDDNFGESFYKTLFNKVYPNDVDLKKMARTISTDKYVGTYRDKRYNRNTAENIVSLFRGSFSIYNNTTKDTLITYHNGSWHSYIPIEGGVFQNIDLPYEFLIFKKDSRGNYETLYRNLNIGGLSLQSSLEKTKWYNSPNFINEYYGFIPLFVFSGLLLTLISLLIRLIRIWKKKFFSSSLLPTKFHILFFATITIAILHTFMGPWYLVKNVQEFLLGYPDTFIIASFLGYLLIPLTIGLGILLWRLWKDKLGNLFSRIYLSLVEVSLLIHITFLFYWNFL